MLEGYIITEDMQSMGGVPRWVPHDKNPSDAMTKADGAHVLPLSKLCATGRWQIREENEELAERKNVKEQLGYVPRPRQPHRSDGDDD